MKRISLILCLIFIMIFLIGCQNNESIPRGISDERLWRDSIKMVNILRDVYKNGNKLSESNDKFIGDYIKKYKLDEKYYNIASPTEQLIIKNIADASYYFYMYLDDIKNNKNENYNKKELEKYLSILNEYIK